MSAPTSARRAARAAAVVRHAGPLDVLLDPAADAWHDRATYHALMADHGWTMPAAERAGATASPGNRRRAAAAGWARDNHVMTEQNMPDLHALRASGLI